MISDSLKDQKKKLNSIVYEHKGLDAKKYSGVIRLKEDPVKYQQRIRSKWDESTD